MSPIRWLVHAWLYFRPHVFAMAGGVAFLWAVRWVTSLHGACRTLCYPPITIGMGLLGGFLGAQLYRSDHPIEADRGG